ncbi:MAG TPA: O-antigen ligase family protein, partial [Terriglobales bacterium]
MTQFAIVRLNERLNGQAAESWFVICSVSALGLLIMAFLWFSGHGTLLRIAFPAVATLVGFVIYLKNAPWYVVYTLSLWFLSPLVRRIVDWQFGFAEPNFVLLAPLLVSGLGILTLLRAPRSIPTPFVLCASGIVYAVVLDILRKPSPETVYGMANWLCPMMFGLHLYLNSDSYEDLRSIITKTFLIAVPLLGLYGIYQFIAPPAWDTNWLTNVSLTDLNPSFGLPEPFQIRVWSTMNAPGPFANTMMAGLLLLITVRSPLKIPVAVAGYLSFLLSAVRSAWLSWGVGLVLILKGLNPRAIVKIVMSLILLVACVLPLLRDPTIGNVVRDRFDTFNDIHQDGSLQARTDMYRVLIGDLLDSPYGYGFKNKGDWHGFAGDSGILVTFFMLGWVGAALFFMGIVSIFLTWGQVDATDSFAISGRGILVALLAQIIAGNVFVGVNGALLWMFAGMALAAQESFV